MTRMRSGVRLPLRPPLLSRISFLGSALGAPESQVGHSLLGDEAANVALRHPEVLSELLDG